MRLVAYRNLWGVEDPWDRAIPSLLDSGYEGIEAVLFTGAQHADMRRALKCRSFPFKGTIWTRGSGPTVAGHLRSFRLQLGKLLRTGATSINVMGGYDCWPADEADRYFEGALKSGMAAGIPVAHEIHRDTALYHPTAARRILKGFPELRLTCDFSHWVVACERLIDDQLDLIRACASRADHVHMRIGTEEIPQIADIRAPEALPYIRAFERWWDIIWEQQLRHGDPVSTFCPEFGPPPYLPTLPYTQKPVANLAGICDWQRDRQIARFKSWIVSRKRATRPTRLG
jgi:hypothetical protein